MKNYIKKTKVKAMQFDGSIAQMIGLGDSHGENYSLTPTKDGLEITPNAEGSIPKLAKVGDWIIDHEGALHVVDTDKFRDEYYADMTRKPKEESIKKEKAPVEIPELKDEADNEPEQKPIKKF